MNKAASMNPLKKFFALALLLVFFVVIASVKFGHVMNYSQSQGRLSIPPRPDDIGYQLQAIRDANQLRSRGWSLDSVGYMFQHRHSPLLNAMVRPVTSSLRLDTLMDRRTGQAFTCLARWRVSLCCWPFRSFSGACSGFRHLVCRFLLEL